MIGILFCSSNILTSYIRVLFSFNHSDRITFTGGKRRKKVLKRKRIGTELKRGFAKQKLKMARRLRNEASSSNSRIESVVEDCGRRRSSCGYCRSPARTSISHGSQFPSSTFHLLAFPFQSLHKLSFFLHGFSFVWTFVASIGLDFIILVFLLLLMLGYVTEMELFSLGN